MRPRRLLVFVLLGACAHTAPDRRVSIRQPSSMTIPSPGDRVDVLAGSEILVQDVAMAPRESPRRTIEIIRGAETGNLADIERWTVVWVLLTPVDSAKVATAQAAGEVFVRRR